MRCVVCGSLHSRVLETRRTAKGAVLRRRRECQRCGARSKTREYVAAKEAFHDAARVTK